MGDGMDKLSSMAADDDFGKLIAAAIIVGGVALLAASAAKSQRENGRADFHARLQSGLSYKGWNLVAASLGVTAQGSHFVVLTLRDALDRLQSIRAELPPGVPPYDQSALHTIVDQVPQAA
jgi:hypothetical protein